jgi:hypothetical protein
MTSTGHRSTMNTIAHELRMRRNERAFERALRTASPSMRQELYAAAARQHPHIM